MQQIKEQQAFEAKKQDEDRRIKRAQRDLDQRSKDLVRLPNRKERAEIDAIEAVLKEERNNMKAKEARHKLTVERLRHQILEGQVGIADSALSLFVFLDCRSFSLSSQQANINSVFVGLLIKHLN